MLEDCEDEDVDEDIVIEESDDEQAESDSAAPAHPGARLPGVVAKVPATKSRGHRGQPAEDHQYTQEDTARLTKLQARARGHLARKAHRERQACSSQPKGKSQACSSSKVAAADDPTKRDVSDLSFFTEDETAALTKIQAAARGRRDRKKVKKQQQSWSKEDEQQLAKIQTAERVLLASLKEDRSPSKGLRPGQHYHDFLAHNESDEVKLKHLKATEKALLARKHNAELDMDRRLQAATEEAEAHAVLQKNKLLPNLESFSEEDTAKVTRLQAQMRGHIDRKHLAKHASEKRHFAAIPGCEFYVSERGQIERKQQKSVVIRQATVTSDLPDLSSFTEEDKSKFIKLQARARGHLSRKRAKEGKFSLKGAVILPDLSSFTVSDQAKVTGLQAQMRGHLARKRLKKRSSSQGKDSALPELSSFTVADEAKVTSLQAQMRGHLARKSLKNRSSAKCLSPHLPELSSFSAADETKVTNLQAQMRGHLARKRVKQQISAKDKGSDLPDLSSFSAADETKVTNLQAQMRGHLARKHLKNPSPAKGKGSDVPDLSSFSEADETKVTSLQAQMRGHLARKSLKNHSSAKGTDSDLPDLSLFSMADETKVTSLQAQMRGHLARKSLKNHSSTKGKAGDLPDLSSFSVADETKVTNLQAQMRGHLARKSLKNHSSAKGKNCDLPDLSSFSVADETKVTSLQAQMRGHLARKHLGKTSSEKRQGSTPNKCSSPTEEDNTFFTSLEGYSPVKGVKPQNQKPPKKGKEHSSGSDASDLMCSAASHAQQPPSEKLAKAEQDGPVVELVPVKPAGCPPRAPRRVFRPKQPPDPAKVLSEESLTRRVERRLNQKIQYMLTNVPTWRPPTDPYSPVFCQPLPRVQLSALSETARQNLLRTERRDAAAELKAATKEADLQQQRVEVEARLVQWQEQRYAAKMAELERKRVLEEENEKAERERVLKFRKQGEALRRKVGQWGAEKAERDEEQERAKNVVLNDTKKGEEEKRKRRQKKLKSRLARWYGGKPPAAIADSAVDKDMSQVCACDQDAATADCQK